MWLRLNVADEGDKDEIIGEWKGDAKPFLQQTLVRALVLAFLVYCGLMSNCYDEM